VGTRPWSNNASSKGIVDADARDGRGNTAIIEGDMTILWILVIGSSQKLAENGGKVPADLRN
jgi:hypothetical protein